MRKFAFILICAVAIRAAAQNPAVTVQVDLAKSEGVYKPIYSWFGYDEANYTTMKYGAAVADESCTISPGAGLHARASPVHVGQRRCRAEVQLD